MASDAHYLIKTGTLLAVIFIFADSPYIFLLSTLPFYAALLNSSSLEKYFSASD